MLLSSFIQESTAALGRLYPAPEARSMVLMLCEERLGVKSYTHIVIPSTEIPDEALPGLQEDMRRLLASEPLQYVLGFTMFYGRRFNVTPDVLIPRPETELLVDEAVKAGLALGRKLRVLDLCTGSGCIAWSLFQELQDAEVVDEEPLALEEREKKAIRTALERHGGRRTLAAQDLHISERTLYRKIKEYGIEI